MNNFIYENKTKVYFGKGGVKEYLGCLLKRYGETVMLAYGGGSIKRNGVYDEVMSILNARGKRVVEFSGIMPNPTYQKVQEGAKLARENHVDLILAVGGGSVSDCCKIISAQAMLDEDIWDMEMVKHTYRHHDGLLEVARLSGKYAKLREAFEKAYEAAASHQNDDGGTCNFDRMWLHLQSHEEMRVAAAAKQVGLRAFKGNFLHKKVYFVEPPFGGQGFRRTKQAEAMCEAMKSLGYTAGMFYQMD